MDHEIESLAWRLAALTVDELAEVAARMALFRGGSYGGIYVLGLPPNQLPEAQRHEHDGEAWMATTGNKAGGGASLSSHHVSITGSREG